MTAVASRIVAALALAVVVTYPVQALFTAEGVPALARGLFVVWLLGAWWSPRATLSALVLLAPLLPIVPSLVGWPSTLSLAQVALSALLAAALARQLVAGRVPGVPAAVAILVAWMSASLLVALWPLQFVKGGLPGLLAEVHAYATSDVLFAMSQRQLLASVAAWVVMIEGLALLWLIRAALADGGDTWRRRFLVSAATGTVIAALVGVVQWWTRWNLIPFWVAIDPHITRVNATFTDVNAFGAFLASMAPVVAAVAGVSSSSRWRIGWAIGFVVVMMATVFTGSRAAWVAFVVGLSLYVALLLRHRLLAVWRVDEGRLARVTLAGTALAVMLVVGLSVVATTRDVRHAQQNSYLDTVLFTLNFRAPVDERLKGRAGLWAAAGAMIHAEPLEGIGLGRYFKDVSSYVPEGMRLIRPQENAHNYFLQLAAELGLPGLVLFLMVVGAAVAGGFSAARDRSRSPAERRLILGAAVGVVAFLLTCFTGHSLLLREGQLTFWILPACAWVASSSGSRAGTGRTVIVAAVGLVLVTATLPLRAAKQATRVNLTYVTEGFHAEETDERGEPFRWTGSDASFYVPADSRAFDLRVRRFAPFDQHVSVVIDGRLIETIDLAPHAWHDLRYLTPRSTNSATRFVRVDLRISPTWYPPDDDRELGVIVGGVSVER